ncbi:MAG: hypothetical protein DCC58_04950 [Chloroflexi bacterium]|nr:MAG: hypothetical protein DCC58_04950 [Chloroflexota bacterium]
MVLGSSAVHRRTGIAEFLRELWKPLAAWLDHQLTWLSLAGSLLLVVALYGRALDFAFFFDDTFDLTRTEGRTYWSLLASSEGYSYYRPIPFLIWKFLRSVQGNYDQTTLHALPLIAHAFSGWLLFLLLRRLGYGNWALLPGLLFITYPFHYQNIPIVGTLFHPLAGAALLAALTLYLYAQGATNRRQARALHCAALAATTVALWSHESGVAVAPLLLALEAQRMWRGGIRRPSPWIIGHLALVITFVLTWFSVEKTPFGETTNLAELRPKGLFLLQGFTYPFSAQLVWLEQQIGWAPGLLEAGMAAIAVVFGAYAVAGVRRGLRGRALLVSLALPSAALTLSVAAFAPSLARLSYGYVQDSPRLLYLVGIGAAAFWGLLPALDFNHRRTTRIWRIVTCTLLFGVIVQSWRFIDVRMEMFARGTVVINEIVQLGERYRGQRALVVNAPAWFAQDRYEYLYGHFGVQLMPSYIGLDRVVYTSSAFSAFTQVASASWNPAVSDGPYPFGPHGATAPPEQLDALLREGRHLIDVRPYQQRFIVRDVGRLVPGGAQPLTTFPGTIASTVSLSPARTVVDHSEIIVLFSWHVLEPLPEDANAVVSIRAAGNETVAEYVGYPLAGYSAPRLWLSGDRIDDSVRFDPLPAGEYSIWVGLRSVDSGDALPVQAEVGASSSQIMIGSFSVP